jgi:hypothetical protein
MVLVGVVLEIVAIRSGPLGRDVGLAPAEHHDDCDDREDRRERTDAKENEPDQPPRPEVQ